MTTERSDFTTRLDDALDRLPHGIEPERDLWPSIESRLGPREGRVARRWFWPAAAGVLLVVGSSLLTATLLRRDEPLVSCVAEGTSGSSSWGTTTPTRTSSVAHPRLRSSGSRSAGVATAPPPIT